MRQGTDPSVEATVKGAIPGAAIITLCTVAWQVRYLMVVHSITLVRHPQFPTNLQLMYGEIFIEISIFSFYLLLTERNTV